MSNFKQYFCYMQLKFYENDPQILGVYDTYEEALKRIQSEFDITETSDYTESNFQQCFHREWLTTNKSRRVWIKAYKMGDYDYYKN